MTPRDRMRLAEAAMGGDTSALAKLGLKACDLAELYAIMCDAVAEMTPGEQADGAAAAARELDAIGRGRGIS